MSLLKDSKERSRFLRYAMVGTFGALVDFSVLNLLTSIFGMSSVIASVISFISAVVSNFTLNRYWTFPDSRSKKVSSQLMQFAMVSVLGLAIRTPIFVFLAISPSIFTFKFGQYIKVLKILKKANLYKLKVMGVRFLYKDYIRVYNFSKLLYPIYVHIRKRILCF